MSKIKKLIEKLCPEGVEWKKLGEVCKIITAPRKLPKNEYLSKGLFPIIDQGQEYIIGYTDEEEGLLPSSEYILYGDHTRIVKYFKGTFMQGADGLKILKVSDKGLTRYVYHALCHFNIPSVGYRRHWSLAKEIEIPVPPLPVQEEIVRILDKFTTLEAELEAELDCRKRQYEFYRDHFFSPEKVSQAISKPLSEVGTLTRGKRFVRTDIVESGVPCIHYGDMYTYYGLTAHKAKTHLTQEKASKMRFAKKNDVVIVGAGENKMDIGIGVAWLGEEDAAVHDACYIFKSDLNPQYVSHFLRTSGYHKQIFPLVSEGKICSISAQSLGRAVIPVPSMEEQRRIVSILDRFEALTTDLQSGLPAEIKARRKQYEYYREKLLTFKRCQN